MRPAPARRGHLPCLTLEHYRPNTNKQSQRPKRLRTLLAQYHEDTTYVVRLSRISIRPRAVVSDPAHSSPYYFLRRPSALFSPVRLKFAHTHSRVAIPRKRPGTPPTRTTKAIAVSLPKYSRRFLPVHLPVKPAVETFATFSLVLEAADCLICCPTAKVSLSTNYSVFFCTL